MEMRGVSLLGDVLFLLSICVIGLDQERNKAHSQQHVLLRLVRREQVPEVVTNK